MPLEEILEMFSMSDSLEGILVSNSMRYVVFLRAHALLKILNEKNLAMARDMNPLSKLAGNHLIFEYVSRVLQNINESYTLIYFDFDNFKAYNDTYGYREFGIVIPSAKRQPDLFTGKDRQTMAAMKKAAKSSQDKMAVADLKHFDHPEPCEVITLSESHIPSRKAV